MLRRSSIAVILWAACAGEPMDSDTDMGVDPDPDPDFVLQEDEFVPQDPDSWWPEGSTLLPEVTVVDANGVRGPRWIIVDGATIHAVLDADPGAPPAWVEELPVRGAYVTPGLIDPHVHLFLSGASVDVGDALEANLRANLWFGVTSVVDAGGPETAAGLASLRVRPDWQGPSVMVLSPQVTVPLSHPCETWNQPSRCWYVELGGDGALLGKRALDLGFDGVKVALTGADHTDWPTPRLDPQEARAAFAEAHASGRLTYAHTDTVEDALLAVDAGARHLAHPVFGDLLTTNTAATLAQTTDSVHTTLGAFDGTVRLLDDDVDWDALDGVVPDAVLDNWRFVRDNPDVLVEGWVEGSEEWADFAEANLRLLHRARATVLPASDAGYLFVPHGLGLHHELEALQQAGGLKPLDVLAVATRDAAAAVGWSRRGVIRDRYRADLLVLDDDPSQDLRALRDPRIVMAGGRAWTREALATTWRPLAAPTRRSTGEFCIGDLECQSGACDGWTHTCQLGCDEAYSVDNACGPDAVCAAGESGPVCRPVRSCDVYAPACAPGDYDENCVPSDRDTAICWPSGPRQEWETCGFADPATFCDTGLTCSVLDGFCYRICNPDAVVDGCSDGTECRVQQVSGVDWYGLCLP